MTRPAPPSFPAPSGAAAADRFDGAASRERARRAARLRARAEAAAADGPMRDRAAPRAAGASAANAARDWPRPPSALVAARLGDPPPGARVTVCGLVIVRQRPGSAKGVLFLTLEDETGVVNVVVWTRVYEAFRRAVIAGRLLRVTGRVQREGAVIHVVAETIEDVSHLLDTLAAAPLDPALARADEVRRPQPEGSRPGAGGPAHRARRRIGGG